MTDTSATDRVSGWHRVSIGHLVMGIAFVGIVAVWALIQSDTVTGDDIRWLLPIPWVVAGAVGLAVTAVSGQRRYAVRQSGWVGGKPASTRSATEPEAPEAPEAAVEPDLTEPLRPAQGLPKYPETKQLPEEKA